MPCGADGVLEQLCGPGGALADWHLEAAKMGCRSRLSESRCLTRHSVRKSTDTSYPSPCILRPSTASGLVPTAVSFCARRLVGPSCRRCWSKRRTALGAQSACARVSSTTTPAFQVTLTRNASEPPRAQRSAVFGYDGSPQTTSALGAFGSIETSPPTSRTKLGGLHGA